MNTGFVVNNYDPKCKNRIQVRVDGLHTQKVNGKFLILDDDLPWALPAPSVGNTSGGYSVPAVGDQVYVDVKDTYNLVYYGRVENRGSVKELIHDNTEDSGKLKVIAYVEDYNADGTKEYVKIYYLPEKGLTIECNDNVITMPKYDSMEIRTKSGAGLAIDTMTNNITIHTTAKVTLDCQEVNLTANAEEKLILGSKLMKKFNEHTHFVPGGQSNPPIQKLQPKDFSDKIKIG